MNEEFITTASVNFNQSYSAAISESAVATSVLPYHFESQAKELVSLIEAYYRYLNSKGGPSYEIAKLSSNHDIDIVEDTKYLDAIEKTIAANIPQSRALDRKRLFKIIANYYTNRGSEDSIYSFFRIFFNEIVSISYPRENLFNTSGERSKTSDKFLTRDNFRWQEFSYVVKSELYSREWKYEYLKYIHPAGLKFFAAIVIFAFKNNNWFTSENLELIKNGSQIDIDSAWNNIDWEKFLGYHSPLFQPGTFIDPDRIIAVLNNSKYHYKTKINKIKGVNDDALTAMWLFLLVTFISTNSNTRHSISRNSWRVYDKFIDRGKIGEYATCTIHDAEFGSNDYGNGPQFNTLNTHVVGNNFVKSYVEFRCEILKPWYDKDETPDSPFYEIYQPSAGVALRDDYTLSSAKSYFNSFIFKILPSSNLPSNSYLTPDGFDAYYYNSGDYYLQPNI